MKKEKIMLPISVAAIAAASAAVYLRKKNVDFSGYELPEGFTLTAHTGCEGTEDNSLDSIIAGAKEGADIVEIDLHFLDDGTPVMSHDKPDEKTAVPLESAFSLLADLDVKMNVDVKDTKNLPAVVSLAEKLGVTDKIFFTGIEEKDVEAVKRDAPGVPYYLNFSVDKKKNTDLFYLDSLVEKVKGNGAVGINMNYKAASGELVGVFRKEGLLVSLWTANSKKTMGSCLSYAPDNITTRKPSMLKR